MSVVFFFFFINFISILFDLYLLELGVVEEPEILQQEMKTLHSSVHGVKETVNEKNNELEKELAIFAEYKVELDDITTWLVEAEISSDISDSKPSTYEDITIELNDTKVIYLTF